MSSLIYSHYDQCAEFDRLFEDALRARFWPSTFAHERGQRARPQPLNSSRPRLDLRESKDPNTVTTTFELPGLRPEDVIIDVHHSRLTISGESSISQSHDEDGFAVRKRHHEKFSRTLQLPTGIKAEDVKAKMEHGLLTLTYPKAAAEQQPHRIAIH